MMYMLLLLRNLKDSSTCPFKRDQCIQLFGQLVDQYVKIPFNADIVESFEFGWIQAIDHLYFGISSVPTSTNRMKADQVDENDLEDDTRKSNLFSKLIIFSTQVFNRYRANNISSMNSLRKNVIYGLQMVKRYDYGISYGGVESFIKIVLMLCIDHDERISILACEILLQFLQHDSIKQELPNSIYLDVQSTCLIAMGYQSLKMQEIAFKILTLTGAVPVSRENAVGEYCRDGKDPEDSLPNASELRRQIQKHLTVREKDNSTTRLLNAVLQSFSSGQISSFSSSHSLKGQALLFGGPSFLVDCLERKYKNDESFTAVDRYLTSALPFSGYLSLIWCLWMSAQECVHNRLRTSLGGPAQTFGKIEQWVHALCDSTLMSYHEDVSFQSRMLLEFLAALERYMTLASSTAESGKESLMKIQSFNHRNSNSGSSVDFPRVQLPQFSSNSTSFFRANEKVCIDWMTRLRQDLVTLSFQTQNYDFVLRHGMLRLKANQRKLVHYWKKLSTSKMAESSFGEEKLDHLRSYTSTEWKNYLCALDQTLYRIGHSLCFSRQADTILGLHRWRKKLLGQIGFRHEVEERMEFSWMNGILLEVNGHYEDSIQAYDQFLDLCFSSIIKDTKDDGDNMDAVKISLPWYFYSNESLYGIVNRVINNCIAVEAWSFLYIWIDKIQALRQQFGSKYPEVYQIFQFEMNLDVLKNLSQFSLNSKKTLDGSIFTQNDALQSPSPSFHSTLESIIWQNVLQRGNMWQEEQKSQENPSPSLMQTGRKLLSLQEIDRNKYEDLNPIVGQFQCLKVLFPSSKTAEDDLSPSTPLQQMFSTLNSMELSSSSDLHLWTRNAHIYEECNREGERRTLPLIFQHQLVIQCRKKRNYKLAQALLDRLDTTTNQLISKYEQTQLNYDIGNRAQACLNLGEILTECYRKTENMGGRDSSMQSHNEEALFRVKMFTRFASWIYQLNEEEDVSVLNRFRSQPWDAILANDKIKAHLATPFSGLKECIQKLRIRDEISGKCFLSATYLYPDSAFAWLKYSHWCYKQGTDQVNLIKKQGLFSTLCTVEESDQLENWISEMKFTSQKEGADLKGTILLIEKQMVELPNTNAGQNSFLYSNEFQTFLERIMERKRNYFFQAIRGYFQFLKLISETDQSESSSTVSSSSSITVCTLRLLRLLVNNGTEYQDLFQLEFQQAQPSQWYRLVPQLFSRLKHPVKPISQQIQQFVKVLCFRFPHSLVYPLIVRGADEVDTYYEDDEDAGDENDINKPISCILNQLRTTHFHLVQEAQQFVTEMKRISSLWDESWMKKLYSIEKDVMKRCRTLEQEIQRLQEKQSQPAAGFTQVAVESYHLIMEPVKLQLIQLWNETIGPFIDSGENQGDDYKSTNFNLFQKMKNEAPVLDSTSLTAHEQQFLHQYGIQLRQGLENFISGKFATEPYRAWESFHHILKGMKERSKTQPREYDLSVLSPHLASSSTFLLNRLILPGEKSQDLQMVTVRQISSVIQVLPTKTKPKQFKMIASDGRAYHYLLKGNEDLHLDEKIMQLMDHLNQLLLFQQKKRVSSRDGQLRNYPVLPLSHQAGLIQMIPNVTSLFDIYQQAMTEQQVTITNTSSSAPSTSLTDSSQKPPARTPISSPTAMFYQKLHQLLQQEGISKTIARKEWPLRILKQVYNDLSGQVPKSCIAKLFWNQSPGPKEWWTKSCRFAQSFGMHSVFGYMIGLGDRHLENHLLSFDSGDFISIDYQICFNQGQALKVPEIVPFRCTSILQSALGETLQTENGVFRQQFEHTLETFRAHREMILTLLEAFVYDPILDWDRFDSASRRIKLKQKFHVQDPQQWMEMKNALAQFLSQKQEIQVQLCEFVDQMKQQLIKLMSRRTKTITISSPFWLKGEFSSTGDLTQEEYWHELMNELQNESEWIEHEVLETQKQYEVDYNQLLSKRRQFETTLTSFTQQRNTPLALFIAECQDQNAAIVEHVLACDHDQNSSSSATASFPVELREIEKELKTLHYEGNCLKMKTLVQELNDAFDPLLEDLVLPQDQHSSQLVLDDIGKRIDTIRFHFHRLSKVELEKEEARIRAQFCQISHAVSIAQQEHLDLKATFPSPAQSFPIITAPFQATMTQALESITSFVIRLHLSNAQSQRVLLLVVWKWISEPVVEESHNSSTDVFGSSNGEENNEHGNNLSSLNRTMSSSEIKCHRLKWMNHIWQSSSFWEVCHVFKFKVMGFLMSLDIALTPRRSLNRLKASKFQDEFLNISTIASWNTLRGSKSGSISSSTPVLNTSNYGVHELMDILASVDWMESFYSKFHLTFISKWINHSRVLREEANSRITTSDDRKKLMIKTWIQEFGMEGDLPVAVRCNDQRMEDLLEKIYSMLFEVLDERVITPEELEMKCRAPVDKFLEFEIFPQLMKQLGNWKTTFDELILPPESTFEQELEKNLPNSMSSSSTTIAKIFDTSGTIISNNDPPRSHEHHEKLSMMIYLQLQPLFKSLFESGQKLWTSHQMNSMFSAIHHQSESQLQNLHHQYHSLVWCHDGYYDRPDTILALPTRSHIFGQIQSFIENDGCESEASRKTLSLWTLFHQSSIDQWKKWATTPVGSSQSSSHNHAEYLSRLYERGLEYLKQAETFWTDQLHLLKDIQELEHHLNVKYTLKTELQEERLNRVQRMILKMNHQVQNKLPTEVKIFYDECQHIYLNLGQLLFPSSSRDLVTTSQERVMNSLEKSSKSIQTLIKQGLKYLPDDDPEEEEEEKGLKLKALEYLKQYQEHAHLLMNFRKEVQRLVRDSQWFASQLTIESQPTLKDPSAAVSIFCKWNAFLYSMRERLEVFPFHELAQYLDSRVERMDDICQLSHKQLYEEEERELEEEEEEERDEEISAEFHPEQTQASVMKHRDTTKKIKDIKRMNHPVVEQERNAYAVKVLKQIKEKLEGRVDDNDPASSKSLTVTEQATVLIEQATNVESLCRMYEGWTPWI